MFPVAGSGTVVTGTLTGGSLARGAALELWPGALPVRVRGLERHGVPAEELPPGVRAAVNLAGVRLEQVRRGMTLAPAGALEVTERVDVSLTLLPDAPYPVKNNSQLHLHHGTRAVVCRCVLLGRDKLEPGETGFAQLRLAGPLAALEGDRFVVRFFSPLATLGGGVILETHPPAGGGTTRSGWRAWPSGPPVTPSPSPGGSWRRRGRSPSAPGPGPLPGRRRGGGCGLGSSPPPPWPESGRRPWSCNGRGWTAPPSGTGSFPACPGERRRAPGGPALPAAAPASAALEGAVEALYRRAGLQARRTGRRRRPSPAGCGR